MLRVAPVQQRASVSVSSPRKHRRVPFLALRATVVLVLGVVASVLALRNVARSRSALPPALTRRALAATFLSSQPVCCLTLSVAPARRC